MARIPAVRRSLRAIVHRLLVFVALAGVLLAPAAAPAQQPSSRPTTAALTAQQADLFIAALRRDRAVLRPIRAGLRTGRASLVSRVTFADLTQDGRADVVVRVTDRGALGAFAVYVLASDTPADPLRPVYRSQSLVRATALVADGALLVRTPRYGAADPLQRPDDVLERRLTWSARAKRLVLRSTRSLRT